MLATSSRKVINRLKAEGWVEVGGFTHAKFEHPDRTETLSVPRHKELSPGVARDIAKRAGWT
jgi:predicted RNA binding protein YcfA (HicA-like mRNA interferase family)